MDASQQERLNKIMSTQAAVPAPPAPLVQSEVPAPEPIIPEPSPGVGTAEGSSMAAKKKTSFPLVIGIGVVFFIVYAIFWAYIFKVIKF
jgi:hypothetical protein